MKENTKILISTLIFVIIACCSVISFAQTAPESNPTIFEENLSCYISGIFTLGDNAVALPDDLPVQLKLKDNEGHNPDYLYTITLPSGETVVEFLLPAKYGEYTLSYCANAKSITQQHISIQWYDYEEVIYADSDVGGIKAVCQYGDVIEGVIKLPDGMVAPQGGIDIAVSSDRAVAVTIPEGQNSVNYAVSSSDSVYITQLNAETDTLHIESVRIPDYKASVITLEPIFTIFGKIEFNEPVEYDGTIKIYVSNEGKGYTKTCSVDYYESDLFAEYCVEISRFSSGVKLGDVLDIKISGSKNDIYLSYSKEIPEAVVISGYMSECDFDVELKKRPEIIKGTICLPDGFNANSIYIRAESESKRLIDTIHIDKDTKNAEFVLGGNSENIDDYNGQYELYIMASGYTEYDLYYNDGIMSFDEFCTITVDGKTVELELNIPEENLRFVGTAQIPRSCNSDMHIGVNIIEKDTSNVAGSRNIIIPCGETSAEFDIGYLLKNKEYIVSYSVTGKDISPFYAGMELYITENGCSEKPVEAKTYIVSEEAQEVYFDLNALLCSSYIEGTINIPQGISMEENTFFNVNIMALSNDRTETVSVKFSAGETEKQYSISIPDLYRKSQWKLKYNIGKETKIPSVPSEIVIDDTTFKQYKLAIGGGTVIGPNYNVIPEGIIRGIDVYYTADGITYSESSAVDIWLKETEVYTADITLGTIQEEHLRTIGGYFCATDGDISVKIELYDINEDKVLESLEIQSEAEYEFYELKTCSINDLVIRYVYDNKIEYYSGGKSLVESIDNAAVLAVESNPVVYVNDAYENNMYCKDLNDRYFRYQISGFNYDDIKVSLYDIAGNFLQGVRGEEGYIKADTADAFIGFEFGGKRYYFANEPILSIQRPELYSFSEDINDAYLYRLPHKSYDVCVILDLYNFIPGRATGDINTAVRESYFYYSENEFYIHIDSLYLNATEGMFEGDRSVYLAFYAENGQLLEMRTITDKPYNGIIPVNFNLPENGYVKIMGFEENLRPLIKTIEFFGKIKLRKR